MCYKQQGLSADGSHTHRHKLQQQQGSSRPAWITLDISYVAGLGEVPTHGVLSIGSCPRILLKNPAYLTYVELWRSYICRSLPAPSLPVRFRRCPDSQAASVALLHSLQTP